MQALSILLVDIAQHLSQVASSTRLFRLVLAFAWQTSPTTGNAMQHNAIRHSMQALCAAVRTRWFVKSVLSASLGSIMLAQQFVKSP
eukprot:4371455-Amphidinium_carterae.1